MASRGPTLGGWVWQRKPFIWGAVVTTGGSRKELSCEEEENRARQSLGGLGPHPLSPPHPP